MWIPLRRVLLLWLAFALPLQQFATAAVFGCDRGSLPVKQAAQFGQAMGEAETPGAPNPPHCHAASQTRHDSTPAHSHPACHGQCLLCAGAGTSQLAPPSLSLPSLRQYALAQLGALQPWRIQFLTPGPERPPRTLV